MFSPSFTGMIIIAFASLCFNDKPTIYYREGRHFYPTEQIFALSSRIELPEKICISLCIKALMEYSYLATALFSPIPNLNAA